MLADEGTHSSALLSEPIMQVSALYSKHRRKKEWMNEHAKIRCFETPSWRECLRTKKWEEALGLKPPFLPHSLLLSYLFSLSKKLWMIKGIKGSRNGAQENLVLIEEFPAMAGNSCHFCRVHFLPPHSFPLSFSLSFQPVIIHKWPNNVAHMSYPNKCSHPILDQQTQLIHYVSSREKVHKNIKQDNYFQH